MAPSTRRRHYASWVIVIDKKASRPEYLRYATLIHRCTVGNLIMDSIAHLENATFVPSYLNSIARSINFYHDTSRDFPFRWKNTFLLVLADSTIHYTRRLESVMMIILRWFLLRRGGSLICEMDYIICEMDYIRCWRDERKRQVVRSTVRDDIEWTKYWVIVYFNTD